MTFEIKQIENNVLNSMCRYKSGKNHKIMKIK